MYSELLSTSRRGLFVTDAAVADPPLLFPLDRRIYDILPRCRFSHGGGHNNAIDPVSDYRIR